ncbi:MAG: VOC family protein [Steroidobacteraceae bacterium]
MIRQISQVALLVRDYDDFQRDYENMKSHGVRFTEKPRQEPYGTVVVFVDLYGNKWDLIGPVRPS